MNSYVYEIVVEPDRFENGRDAWHASCPVLKGCHSWGHSYEEALANIREAIELYVQDLLEAGETIPGEHA
jgi:predicted RNase H-like HicB family nuclease